MIAMHCIYPDDRHYLISQNCTKMLSVSIPSKNILRCKTERATGVDWTSGHVDVDMKILDIQPPLSLRRVSPVRPRALSDGSRRMLGMLPAPASDASHSQVKEPAMPTAMPACWILRSGLTLVHSRDPVKIAETPLRGCCLQLLGEIRHRNSN